MSRIVAGEVLLVVIFRVSSGPAAVVARVADSIHVMGFCVVSYHTGT